MTNLEVDTMKNCDGCRFQGTGSKRCQTCARQYVDRYEEPPKRTKADERKAAAALSALALMHELTKNSRY